MANSIELPAETDLYEADENAWIERHRIRDGAFDRLDRANLIEFLNLRAARDRRELASRMTLLMQHMMKFIVPPERASRSWDTDHFGAAAGGSPPTRRDPKSACPSRWGFARGLSRRQKSGIGRDGRADFSPAFTTFHTRQDSGHSILSRRLRRSNRLRHPLSLDGPPGGLPSLIELRQTPVRIGVSLVLHLSRPLLRPGPAMRRDVEDDP